MSPKISSKFLQSTNNTPVLVTNTSRENEDQKSFPKTSNEDQTPLVKQFTLNELTEPIQKEQMEQELLSKQKTNKKSLLNHKLFILNNSKSKVERFNLNMTMTRNFQKANTPKQLTKITEGISSCKDLERDGCPQSSIKKS